MLFVNLLVVAYLVVDLGVRRPDFNEMRHRALAKLPVFLGYSLIFGAALSVMFMIILMPVLAPLADQLGGGSGNLDLGLFRLSDAGPFALGVSGVAFLLTANGLYALWMLVPVLHIAENRGFAAMGESARRVRPYYWRIYLIALIAGLVHAVLLVFPQFLVLTGQLQDNLLNWALLGVPEGLRLAISLAIAVLVWQRLERRRQDA